MSNMLFELGCEEIPARFMVNIEKQVKDLFEKGLSDSHILFEKVNVFSTYRRIAVVAEGLKENTEVSSIEVKGPPEKVAYKDGQPTKAAEGFAKKNGVALECLTLKDGYLYAVVEQKILPVKESLPLIMENVLQKLYLPVAMHWGTEKQTFVRPVHWLLFLLDGQIVPFDFASKSSGNLTRGHRIFGKRNDKGWSGNCAVSDYSEYQNALKSNFVVLDADERKEIIKKSLISLSEKANVNPVMDDSLLEEVTYLCEYPVVLMAEFPERFLEVPSEVLIATMQKNQKYFPSYLQDGKLSNKYFIVSDAANEKSSENIINGNNKVLVARLEDASFFFNEDKKKNLLDLIPNLKNIVFQEKLGTIYEKMERVAIVSAWLNDNVYASKFDKDTIDNTVMLLKADLVTKMVYEFPEVQGIMGKKYALFFGEKLETADAILEHYLPKYSGDKVPASDLGTICSLADKIDSIVGCFSVDLIPSGSADPYALRRAAQGIVNIISEKQIKIDLKDLIEVAFRNVSNTNREKVIEFFKQRVRTIFIDKKFSYDLVDSVLAINSTDISLVSDRLAIVAEMKNNNSFKEMSEAAVRLGRLSEKLKMEPLVDTSLFEKDIEKSLYSAVVGLSDKDIKELSKECFLLVPLVTRFFDEIMVMVEDDRIKNNRLSLVSLVSSLYKKIADFDKVVL